MLLLVHVVGQICFIRIKSNFSHADRGKLLLYIVLKKKKREDLKLDCFCTRAFEKKCFVRLLD